MQQPAELSVATLLKQERMRSGMTIRALADAAGLVPSTVSRLESGAIGSPKPIHLQRIARALGIEVEDFYSAAGIMAARSLPGLRPYLRTKYGLSDEVAYRVEGYIEAQKDNKTILTKEDNDDDNRKDEAP